MTRTEDVSLSLSELNILPPYPVEHAHINQHTHTPQSGLLRVSHAILPACVHEPHRSLPVQTCMTGRYATNMYKLKATTQPSATSHCKKIYH